MLIYFQKVKTQAFAFQTIMLSAHYFRRSNNIHANNGKSLLKQIIAFCQQI